MKIALYIEDGIEQIVLTPQGDTERAILGKLHDGTRALQIKRGAFYACAGGWIRHSIGYTHEQDDPDRSTILVLSLASTT